MGDHVCAPGMLTIVRMSQLEANVPPAPPLPDARLKALDGPFAPSVSRPTMGPPPPKFTKAPPSRLIPTSTCMLIPRLEDVHQANKN